MRRIGVVTSARSDLGIYEPVLDEIQAREGLALEVVATGMHLSGAHGRSVEQVAALGVEIVAEVESLVPGDGPGETGESIARGVAGMSHLFERWRPDLLLTLGDRFDMLPAPLAALPHQIGVAHIHGGELTEGAIDDALRHCITKLSHLHFTATRAYAERVIQLGEEPWRVTTSGAPGLDRIGRGPRCTTADLRERFGLEPGFLLVTLHAETLGAERPDAQAAELLEALDKTGRACVFTAPNADPGGLAIRRAVEAWCDTRPDARLVQNAGRDYLDLMAHAAAMVGNSSSGIIEAASFGLPVVNVGERQRGRERAANVIDCGSRADQIGAALERALDRRFRDGLRGLVNPYGDGRAAERIVDVLAAAPLGPELLVKRFHDVRGAIDA